MVITRKITLYPQGDKNEVNRIYNYIRNGMEVQSLMMNQYMSALYNAKLNKWDKDQIREMNQLYSRIPSSKKGSAYDFDMSKYPTGLPIAGSIPHLCADLFSKACKDGLMYGKVSLPTYKSDSPMYVPVTAIDVIGTRIKQGRTVTTGIYHDYDTPGALVNALENDNNPNVHIKSDR